METAGVPAAVSKHKLISARDSHLCQPEIRPNFSGSHTFSLTGTGKIGFRFALPAGMLLQSETKIEPDLRLHLSM